MFGSTGETLLLRQGWAADALACVARSRPWAKLGGGVAIGWLGRLDRVGTAFCSGWGWGRGWRVCQQEGAMLGLRQGWASKLGGEGVAVGWLSCLDCIGVCSARVGGEGVTALTSSGGSLPRLRQGSVSLGLGTEGGRRSRQWMGSDARIVSGFDIE